MNMSSASAHRSTFATGAPSCMENAPSFGGFRNATTTWPALSFKAMGKLVPLPVGQFAIAFPAARSMTTIAWLAGSLTKIRFARRSSWKLSGCALSSISATLFRLVGSMTANAPWPYATPLATCKVSEPLRPVQARNDLHDLVGIEIDDRNRVVFELGDKQTITREIDRQVVDAAANFAQRDFPFEQEERFISPTRRNEESARNRQRRGQRFHGIVSSFSVIPTSAFLVVIAPMLQKFV